MIETAEASRGICSSEMSQRIGHRSTLSNGGQLDLNVVIAQTSAHRVDVSEILRVKSLGDFAISRTVRESPGHGMTETQEKTDAFATCVHINNFDQCDIWCDDRVETSRALTPGSIHINDMRREWRVDIQSPFHVVNFYTPRSALDQMADEEERPRIEELRCPTGFAQLDTVLENIALALRPALARPYQVNGLFADSAARTVTAHLAKSYGSFRSGAQYDKGGLAPWQERRARELLMENLGGNITLPEVAGVCRLSTSHFSRAFRRTVGAAPHQWLMAQRIERAKQLLLNTSDALCQIALAAGFADQSHFTRVFSERVKASPGVWRRDQRR